ncbi:VOC family protein [Bradyrhizobium sp. 150]|uniref:VOC family protein n=1 Tax=Bradyrhizobium sp. 150 TaxID=2782625 RepID=UPI001FF915A9|nr:VOC family protein [Bradyrhizobium sp. 150]
MSDLFDHERDENTATQKKRRKSQGGRAMQAAGIGGVYVVVEDMDRAQRFYENALGLVTKFRDRSSWCQFDTGNVSFSLSSSEEAGVSAQSVVVVFKTGQLAGIRRQVEEAGGTFRALRDMGSHGAIATFTDPDGNDFQVLIPSAKSRD